MYNSHGSMSIVYVSVFAVIVFLVVIHLRETCLSLPEFIVSHFIDFSPALRGDAIYLA